MEKPMAKEMKTAAKVGVVTNITGMKNITANSWQTQIRWTRAARVRPVRLMMKSESQPVIGMSSSDTAHGRVLK